MDRLAVREEKTNQVRAALKEGDHKKALRIAKDFRYGMNKEDRKQVVRGWECFWKDDFYMQLGFDPDEEIDKAVKILESLVWGF
jgi:tRNA 2-selenouridine synthase SelU